MATVNEILNKILAYCARPTEDSLGLHDMLTFLHGRIDFYRTLLGCSNRNWLIGRFILTVDASTDEYNISARAGDFARPVLIETYDSVLQNFERRPVDIVEVQNTSLNSPDIVNPTGFPQSQYYKHTARCIAFWGYESSDIKCRVIPQPYQVAEYQVWYETGKVFDPDISDTPMLMPEFHDLLAVHSARLALGSCKWYAPKDYPGVTAIELEGMNDSKRRSQLAIIEPELQDLQRLFDKYSRSNKHERASLRKPFNTYRGNGGNSRGWGW